MRIDKQPGSWPLGVAYVIFIGLCFALFVHDVNADQAQIWLSPKGSSYEIQIDITSRRVFTCPEVEWPADKEMVWHCYPMADAEGSEKVLSEPTRQTWKRTVSLEKGHWVFRLYVQRDNKVVASAHAEKEVP